MRRRLAHLLMAWTCGLTLTAGTAQATTFDVTTTDDEVDMDACGAGDADCSLREAILAANAAGGLDTIRLPAGTYPIQIPKPEEGASTAADGDFDVTDDLAIERSGAGVVVIDGAGLDGVFDMDTGTPDVTVSDVKVVGAARSEGGSPSNFEESGGAFRTAGALTLDRVIVDDNGTNGFGGGVAVRSGGALNAVDSVITNNRSKGSGGGIYGQGPITLTRTVVRGNEAKSGTNSAQGGGIATFFAPVTADNSEISLNTADGSHGGMLVLGALTLRSSTVSGNQSQSTSFSGSGGITVQGNVAILIEDSTIARNRRAATASPGGDEGANLVVSGSSASVPTFTIRRSVIAEPLTAPAGSSPNCDLTTSFGTAAVTSDHSLDDDDSCTLDDPTDIPDGTAGLAALADNGGPTRTHGLLEGSAAIDAGGTGCPATDQRGLGFPRPLGNACDIGAFEGTLTGGGEPDEDADDDGVPDATDNCSATANADQSDADRDGTGDACDPDVDGDNVPNATDNCPAASNGGQADADRDGRGDACDPDLDGDTVPNGTDNCPSVANADQKDEDGGGVGDACESGVLGRVTLDDRPLPGAEVTLCIQAIGCLRQVTTTAGRYQIPIVAPGKATLNVSVASVDLAPSDDIALDVTPGARLVRDVALRGLRGMPKGTSIAPLGHVISKNRVPSVVYYLPFTLEHRACAEAEVSYQIFNPDGRVLTSGTLDRTDEDRQLYRAEVPALSSFTGLATGLGGVVITVEGCDPAGAPPVRFDLYIDPSGFVKDVKGRPVFGATVRLSRADAPAGPFAPAPDGSAIMAPNNRRNPDRTDASGHFGWDVIPGYYTVQAEKAGCTAPGGGTVATTRVLEIPPAVLDLDIRLDCPYKPKLALGPLPRGSLLVDRKGRTSYRLVNLSPFAIRGTVTMKQGRRQAAVGRFKLAANRGRDVRIAVSRKARRLLARKGKLKVTATVAARGAGTKARAKRAITLRRR